MTTATIQDQRAFAIRRSAWALAGLRLASAAAWQVVRALRAASMLLVAVLALASASFAQTTTWSNTPPAGFWSVAGNWSTGAPTSTSSVQIGTLGQTTTPIVTVDVNSNVSQLTLDGNNTQLIITGDSVTNQAAAVNLTVNNNLTIASNSAAISIGGGASLTLNGASSNNGGTINLATTTIIAGEAPDVSQLNGTGTLTNSGTIQGSGTISLNIANTSAGVLTGNLALNGNTVTGGTYQQGNLLAINATLNGVTLGEGEASTVNLLGGSTITIQNELINTGNLNLSNAGGGVTINGPGEILNRGFISGGGTITANINNGMGNITAAGGALPLTLTGNIDGGGPGSSITIDPSSTLVLNGAQVNGNTLFGDGGTLTATNGASFTGGTINGRNTAVSLSSGSVLNVSGTTLVGALTLNNSTITGPGQFQNDGTIQGTGTIALNVQNSSTGVLTGNLTVNGVTVNSGSYAQGNLTSVNAAFEGVNYGGTGGTVTLTGGSNLAIGGGTVTGTLILGSGGVGATTTQIPGGGNLINNGVIEGGGTIGNNIDNGGMNSAGRIASTDTTTPLVLKGFIDTESGSANQAIISIGAHTSLVLDGAQIVGNTIQGNGGLLGATDGAIVSGGVIDGTTDRVLLTGGSSLKVSDVTVKGTFQLGDGSGGANLTGTGLGLNLTDGSILHGGGTITAQIEGVGGGNGNGSIIADNSAAALVLAGNVTGVASVSATSGATLTLQGSTVSTLNASIAAGSTLSGNGTMQVLLGNALVNAGTIAPTGPNGGGVLGINGFYTQASGGAIDFALGSSSSEVIVLNNQTGGPIANFDPNSVFVMSLLASFDPSLGCSTVFGVCEEFTLFETDGISGNDVFTGYSNINFELPALPAGFQWITLDENNDAIVLELEGVQSSSGGGNGNGNGGGNGTMPEPSEWIMLASGLIALFAFTGFARRRRTGRAACC